MSFKKNLQNIKINYILSKNRSGSTLLCKLLNYHPNIITISEENIYWLLKKDYKNIKQFSTEVINKMIDDIYFLSEISGRYSIFSLISAEELKKEIIEHSQKVKNFRDFCNLVYSISFAHIYPEKKTSFFNLVHKELQFNHLINKIYDDSPGAKFIILSRDPRAVAFSSIKTNMGNKNAVYQAKKWVLEMNPLITPALPEKNIFYLQFEQLVNDYEKTMEKLYTFLEVDFNDNCDDKISEKKLISELKKDTKIPEKILRLIEQRHLSTLSEINKEKIQEWETSSFFSEKEVKKIGKICRATSKKIGYEFDENDVSLSLFDYVQMLNAKIDYFVAKKYILLSVFYKRILRKINVLNLYR
jgi:hypothetical protein